MAIQTQQRQQNGTATTQQPPPVKDAATLLDEVLENTTQAAQAKLIRDQLSKDHVLKRFKSLLPDALKSQAERFINRAAFTFSRNPALEGCTVDSFIRCVLQAAEVGLAVDGRLAHAVCYKTTKKDAQGRSHSVKEAQLQIDYKGLICVARRSGIVKDVWANIVCENDVFEAYQSDGQFHMRHEFGFDRGDKIGVYAAVKLHTGEFRFDLMSLADVYKIRARSKAFQYGGGPWKTDEDEMMKKCPVRRILKTLEDPDLAMLAMADDSDDAHEAIPDKKEAIAKLENKMAPRPAMQPVQPTADHDEPPIDEMPEEIDMTPPPAPTPPPANNPSAKCDEARRSSFIERAKAVGLSGPELAKLAEANGGRFSTLTVAVADLLDAELSALEAEQRERDAAENG